MLWGDLFNARPIEESDEERPGLILGQDSKGNVVGTEVLKDLSYSGI